MPELQSFAALPERCQIEARNIISAEGHASSGASSGILRARTRRPGIWQLPGLRHDRYCHKRAYSNFSNILDKEVQAWPLQLPFGNLLNGLSNRSALLSLASRLLALNGPKPVFPTTDQPQETQLLTERGRRSGLRRLESVEP